MHELEQDDSHNVRITIHSKKEKHLLDNNRLFSDTFLKASSTIDEFANEEFEENVWSNDNEFDDEALKGDMNSPTNVRNTGI